MMCEEMIFEYWFSTIRKLSARKKYLLRELIGTGKKIYYIEETEIAGIEFLTEKEKEGLKKARKEKTKEQLKEEFCKMQEHGIEFIPFFSKEYPPGLAEIPDPPYALFVKGTCPGAPKRAAIVGARGCSGYGEHYTREFAEALAAAGVDIISGMAKGIDGTGQRAALNAGGKSYAVLGSGVDVCYPRDHIGLYMDIIEHGGGILSEFPPGTPPLAMNFPMRNRIISGLSDAVLVMEARLRSGSLITADMALEQGKDVYALPGSLDSPLSAGCNQLIQQGAGILLNPENLLEEWGVETNVLCRNTEIKNEKNKKVLESTDDLVYSCVGLYPKNVDQIAQESRVEIRKLMSILVTLELQGYIPAKVKTIKKFLGSNYTVAASQGHVRDLPKSQLGIDVENDYEPKYITIRGKGEILAALRKEAKKSDKVYLATDPDREGEAISWHLAAALKLDEKKMRRITFNEITKNAVKASLKAPRDIDMDLVDAQQGSRD